MTGQWIEPPCFFCARPIQPTSDHHSPVQFLGLRGLWSHAECWQRNRKTWLRRGMAMVATMDLQEIAA